MHTPSYWPLLEGPRVPSRRLASILALALGTLLLLPSPAGAKQVPVACKNANTDDETLNTAITGSAAGDEILISGPCLINATVRLLGKRSYRGGEPSGTVIRQAANANLAAMLATAAWLDNTTVSGQVIIRDLGLDGNSANNTTAETHGMVLLNDASVVENTQILNMRGSGIQLTSTTRAGTPANYIPSPFPTTGGRIAKNVISKPGGHGILIKGMDWLVEVLDNQIDGTGLDGIVLDSGSVCVVRGNYLFMIGRNGIVTKDHVFITTVADNIIQDFGISATAGKSEGISVSGAARAVIQGNTVVVNNPGDGAGNLRTYLNINVGDHQKSLTVIGNTLDGVGGNGLGNNGLHYTYDGSLSTTAWIIKDNLINYIGYIHTSCLKTHENTDSKCDSF